MLPPRPRVHFYDEILFPLPSAMEDSDIEALVSSNRHELIAAATAESDLDLAYHLQLQEAISDSLLHHDSPPPPPPSSPPSTLALTFQTLELERFQQERSDSALSHAEMRRISQTLRLRAHDEKFAREVQEMSDREWEEWGDEFERPVAGGEDGDGDPFQVYVKGLVCEEVVGLSAVGVAVVDSVGNLVMKVQKPVGGGVSRLAREVVEAMAVIEGLNAVFTLGIRRANFYVDNLCLYNHITRRWAIKQRKVANMIEQIWSLQTKLERCGMWLLPRCHMPFVFRLARDAIDSQIKKGVQQNGKNQLKEVCSICLEEIDDCHMFSINICMHCFCFSCMKQHVEVKLLHGILPACPHDGCKTMLDIESSKKFLPPKLVLIMAQRIKEASIPPAEKVYCPYPRCSTLMSRSEAIQLDNGSSSMQPHIVSSGQRKCVKCNGLFCVNCKVPWAWHVNMSCQDYKRFNPHPRVEEIKLQDLARRSRWRQCMKCNQMIELAEGCFHMTCRCGYEFCYTCGAPWKNKKATCQCPLWDEENILHDDNPYDDYYDDSDDYDEDGDDDYYYDQEQEDYVY